MARRSSGLGWLVVLVAVILINVPKEVWIAGGVLLVLAVIGYIFRPDSSSTTRASWSSGTSDSWSYTRTDSSPTIDHSVTSESCWVQPATTITAGNMPISGGMVYAGAGLASVSADRIEPALINLALSFSPAEGKQEIGYWPSYSEISPAARHVYLQWLASGRKDPDVDIGFVFLFFYGLERRVMSDLRDRITEHCDEVRAIVAEVERLRTIYGHNGSFSRYTAAFLDVTRLLLAPRQKHYLADPPEPPETFRHLLLTHKLALGQAAVDGVPLPAAWAYSWLMHDEATRLKTSARRCGEEFKKLFFAEYRKEYGDGMRLPVNKTKIKANYRPASASFGYQEVSLRIEGLPDTTVLSAPIAKLRQIAERISEDLEPYSRFIGRNPDSKGTLDALVLLSPALWPEDSVAALKTWLAQIGADRDMQATRLPELMRHFPAWDSFSKDRAAAFATALEHFGVGMEPDVRWGAALPSEITPIVLFPLPDHQRGSKPSTLYAGAALTVHLAAAVAASDGSISAQEERHLEEQLEQWLHLPEVERRRLRAHLKCLLLAPPSLTALKKRVSALTEAQRHAIASFLIDVAHVEGDMAPAEVKVLAKIYRLFGLPEDALYSQAHAAATAPVTVAKRGERPHGFSLPQRPAPAPTPAKAELDAERIARLKEESAQVSAMLGSIFTEADEPVTEPREEEPQVPQRIAGLDDDHFELARVLAGRRTWAREELTDLAADRNLLLDGALEHLNEAFFEAFNEPLFEGEDPLEINQNVIKELVPA